MSIAIGESQAADALWIQSGEDLGNAAATVVTDQIHLIDMQGVEKFIQHLRVGGNRHVLIRCDFSVTVREQINCDAAANVGQIGQLVTPQMSVQ